METAADFRQQAREYRKRAMSSVQPAAQAMLLAMAVEFERDARLAAREESRAAWRDRAAARVEPTSTKRAA